MYNDLFSIGGLTFHGYGLMIGVGSLLGILWAARRATRRGLSSDLVLTMALWGLVIGFAGSKLLYVITRWREFLVSPWSVLGSEGFVVYGGILTGILAAWICCRRKGADFSAYLDVFMPPVALAQGFGRIGCFLAGCCYGKTTDSILGVVFPAGCGAPAGVSLWPTQLISSAGDFLLAALLALYSRRERPRCYVAAVYLLLYAVGRFLVEFLRDDPRGSVGALSTSQFLSLFAAAAACAIFYINRKGRAKNA